MSQVQSPRPAADILYTRTLLAGLIVGGIAVLALLSSNWFMQNLGLQWMNGGNPLASLAAQAYGFVVSASMPFSAALISAALVMKFLDRRLPPLQAPRAAAAPMEDRGE